MDFSIKNDVEEKGNTNGNISNGGETCEKDGFVYYSGAYSGLYKILLPSFIHGILDLK
ncbi:hypothetical protein [Clostridium sp. DMHC 10]|uniref:hypothetical protein n=1 Tax=Clostridium sp. DMHC 10 TaxID=747377 RepID=UPI000B2D8638|nr:hypothetical protein [Clostridium sp. DMHC 10]